MDIEKKIRKERELLRMAEIAVKNNNFDLVWDILDEAFDSFIHIEAWILTESNPEYSMHSKGLFREVEKYKRVMYDPFRNFEWANQ